VTRFAKCTLSVAAGIRGHSHPRYTGPLLIAHTGTSFNLPE